MTREQWLILALIGTFALWAWTRTQRGQRILLETTEAIVAKLTRGERNNNPGNIRKSGDRWRGLAPVQKDADFFQFTSALYGVRALAKTLLTYQRKHGLKTVAEIISRWAPGHENPTASYIANVASALKVSPSAPIDLSNVTLLTDLTRAIIRQENGRVRLDADTLSEGVQRALDWS